LKEMEKAFVEKEKKDSHVLRVLLVTSLDRGKGHFHVGPQRAFLGKERISRGHCSSGLRPYIVQHKKVSVGGGGKKINKKRRKERDPAKKQPAQHKY